MLASSPLYERACMALSSLRFLGEWRKSLMCRLLLNGVMLLTDTTGHQWMWLVCGRMLGTGRSKERKFISRGVHTPPVLLCNEPHRSVALAVLWWNVWATPQSSCGLDCGYIRLLQMA